LTGCGLVCEGRFWGGGSAKKDAGVKNFDENGPQRLLVLRLQLLT
jgi:hypothetical protein